MHTAEELTEIADRLITSFYKSQTGDLMSRPRVHGKRTTLAVPPTIWALVAHVHHLARPTLAHLTAGQDLIAAPLVRAMYESAITAQWVVRVPSAVAGITHEDLRQIGRLHELVRRAGWAAVVGSTGLSEEDRAQLESPPSVTSRRFNQICADLAPGGDDAYLIYSILSSQAHPGASVMNRYMSEIDRPPGVMIHVEPKPDAQDDTTLFILACSLVWAGAALDWLDQTKMRRPVLKDAARRLEITRDLRLSDAAWVRENGRKARDQNRGRPRGG